jgi:predicted oxidoreductase
LKDLEKLLKLLRKQGVQNFKMGEIELKLGDLPQEMVPAQIEESASNSPYADFPEGMLTPEQLIFYSAGGHPDDDPENRDAQ